MVRVTSRRSRSLQGFLPGRPRYEGRPGKKPWRLRGGGNNPSKAIAPPLARSCVRISGDRFIVRKKYMTRASVDKEAIRKARTADLFDYLLRCHPDEFKREGHWLRLNRNPSICLKRGCGGYKDYSTNKTGNSIDFLVDCMFYDFIDAVTVLAPEASCSSQTDSRIREVVFPERSGSDAAVRSYLSGRGFPETVIESLISDGLLYQDVRRNAVFRSAAGDFYELRGTVKGTTFHRCGKRTPDSFWVFIPQGPAEKAYICEGAIDAVSLYLIHLQTGVSVSKNAYFGIAGVANQQTIEKIRKQLPAVLAVDNDAAGEQCRARNKDLESVIPKAKDWNEDLTSILKNA